MTVTILFYCTGVYVFGELLECENIQALEETEYSSSLQLLKLFTYGTYSDYKRELYRLSLLYHVINIINYSFVLIIENTHALPQLSPTQLTKLKHLTVIALAAKNRVSEIQHNLIRCCHDNINYSIC